MNADQKQYDQSQPYHQTGNEFRVSDVVINDREFHPMRAEQEGFNVSVSAVPYNKSLKNLSQLSRERRRSGSGNNSNGSGVRSNRSNTFVQQQIWVTRYWKIGIIVYINASIEAWVANVLEKSKSLKFHIKKLKDS